MENPHVIQVLIVHEYPLMCSIISKVVDDEPDIHVQSYASSVAQAEEIVLREPIDIILLSPRLPDNGTIKLTKILMNKAPRVKVLILGISETREQVLEYIEAGATGYIIRESSLADLFSVIRAAYKGKALVSPEIALALIHRVKTFSKSYQEAGLTPPDLRALTEREHEVFRLLGQNLSNQEIARRLVISPGTVKNHVHNILNKLGVSNRQEVTELFYAYSKSWLDPDR